MRYLSRALAYAAALLLLVAVAPARADAYGFVGEWGGAGSADGQFTDLRDVATDTADNVFTAEAGRIQKFGPDRGFLAKVPVTAGQTFQSVTVLAGIVYAVERPSGVVQRFSAGNLSSLGPLALGADAATANFAKARSIAPDGFGNLVVTFPDNLGEAGKDSGVATYNTNGAFVRTMGQFDTTGTDDEKYTMPIEAEGSGGNVWVLDASERFLFRFNRSDGTYKGRSAFNPASSWQPEALAIMPGDPLDQSSVPLDHTAYTFDAVAAQQIKVWRDHGGFHYWFGTRGTGEGKFQTVAGMDAGDDQRLFLADSGQSKILEYGEDPTPPPPPPPPPPPTGGGSSGSGGGSSGGSGGGGSPNPNLQPMICIGLWSAATCSWLPPPQPLQVCVSYWQNCNGFAGSKPAKQGTIDLSGFPDSLSTSVACDESAKNPFASGSAGISQAGGGNTERDKERCLLDTFLESDLNAENVTERDLEVAYSNNARTFKAEVASAYAQLIQGLDVVARQFETDPTITTLDAMQRDRLAAALRNAFGADIDDIFDRAARPGSPIVTVNVGIPSELIDKACARFAEAEQVSVCTQSMRALNFQSVTSLAILRVRKRELRLDKSLDTLKAEFRALVKEQEKKLEDLKRRIEELKRKLDASEEAKSGLLKQLQDEYNRIRRKASQSRAKVRPLRRFRVVIGSGRAAIPQGQRRTIKITISKEMRRQLKRMRRRGVRSLRGRAVIQGRLVPGVRYQKTKPVTVRLAKPKQRRRR